MYKILFKMKSPIIFSDLPVWDGIVAYLEYCDKYRKPYDIHSPTGKEIYDIPLPLKMDTLGFYYASYMFFDIAIEGEEKWHKRWENKYDSIAEFRGRRQISIASGWFKAYNIPVPTYSIPECWFFFEGDIDRIEFLVNKYLDGIGKKRSQGFGQFESYDIIEVVIGEQLFCRPVPREFNYNLHNVDIRLGFGAYKPPYWLAKNWCDILKITKRKKANEI